MRWIWIDRILEFEPGRRCVAVKNVSLAEEVVHDHFPALGDKPPYPVMPNTLIVEGMAQTAGILVGHMSGFAKNVILAKVGKARFCAAARPSHSLRFTAMIDRFDQSGAATTGTVQLLDPAVGSPQPLAEIELLFSHVDDSRAYDMFPKKNFVFSRQLMDMLNLQALPPSDLSTA